MNDQAGDWVWEFLNYGIIICKAFFHGDSVAAEEVALDVLVKLSQRKDSDKILNKRAYISKAMRYGCLDYSRKLKQNQVCMARLFEDPGVGADEKLLDAKLDKEVSGSTEDAENKTDEPEKIDPVKWWRFYKRDPDRVEALIRSLFFVSQAFHEIKSNRDFFKGNDQADKLFATLQDVKQQLEKIFGPFTDLDIQKYGDSIGAVHSSEFDFEKESHYSIRELIESLPLGLADEGIKCFTSKGTKKLYHNYNRGAVLLTFYVPYELKDGAMKGDAGNTYVCHHRMRIRDFIDVDRDPLYVLYRVWNRILRKGKQGKYGNRKLLKVLFRAFKNMTAGWEAFDIFDSLTEETNYETLRIMSLYRFNKGYSELADFIYKKSVHPPKKRTKPANEKRPALPASV
jgi:hypothetical protein